MSATTLAWFFLISTWAYILHRDPNVADYVILQSQNLNAKLRRLKWYLTENPEHFWVGRRIYNDNEKNAKVLAEELGLHKNKDWFNDNNSN